MMNKLCLTAREAAMSKDSGLMMNSTVIVHIIFFQKSKSEIEKYPLHVMVQMKTIEFTKKAFHSNLLFIAIKFK